MKRTSYFNTYQPCIDSGSKLEKIKKNIDPVEFYKQEGQEIDTRTRGRWKNGGLCPFHEDHNPNSFFIEPRSGAFYCFACGAKGSDVIAFVQLKYRIPCTDAIRHIYSVWRV